MPPGKLLLTVPMQWLAAIPDRGDAAYREFLVRVSDSCKSGDEDWKMPRAPLKVSKESAAWVDQHYEGTLVRLLGEAQACALVSLSEEPPCKVQKNNASDVVTNHNRKQKRGSQTIIANVTPLGLARMLSNQWYNDEDMNAYIWRLRAGYPDASLMCRHSFTRNSGWGRSTRHRALPEQLAEIILRLQFTFLCIFPLIIGRKPVSHFQTVPAHTLTATTRLRLWSCRMALNDSDRRWA